MERRNEKDLGDKSRTLKVLFKLRPTCEIRTFEKKKSSVLNPNVL
jgi:hypothetical protein